MNEARYPGKVFMYPCSGQDISESIRAFGDQMDTFLFVDIGYQFQQFRMPATPGWSEVVGSVMVVGQPRDSIRNVENGKTHYREVQPAWRSSSYQNVDTGRLIDVVFRRGFGQYALHEVADGTLGMFMHRGDSAGEGGSGTCFLANRRMTHEPISRLLDVIKRKLATPALIASDGSNTTIRQLVAGARGDDSIKSFRKHGLEWTRAASMPGNAGRQTVLWQVIRTEAGSG